MRTPALRNSISRIILLFCGLLLSGYCNSIEIIPVAKNLSEDGKIQLQTKRIILLYVSAPTCAFCKKLENEVIFPLIRSGEYQDTIILRKIDRTSSIPIKDFSGNEVLPSAYLAQYNIQITPTLLFIDAKGHQVIERLSGYRGGEFFWYYFDVAINKANKRLVNSSPSKYQPDINFIQHLTPVILRNQGSYPPSNL